MKKIFIVIFFCIAYYVGKSQAPPQLKNFYTIKQEQERYFDSIKPPVTPDSVFYAEGGEYNQFKQWVAFWEPRVSTNGDFNLYYNKLNESYAQLKSRSTTAYNADWKEIGPLDKPSGDFPVNISGGSDAGIGPIEFIKFYKDQINNTTNHMLCCSTRGGLFFSNDFGAHWVNAGSDLWSGQSAVSWAEFKVDDPEVIYAASGEGVDNNDAGYIGELGGIFRAQKAGTINPNTQWVRIADYINLGGHTDCRIKKLLTDPYNPNVLYAATTWGLFKSINVNSASPTWVKILDDNVYDVELHPGSGNNQIIYASFNRSFKTSPYFPNPNQSTNTNFVKFSTDGGSTWNILPHLPSYTLSQIACVTIEVSAAFPDNIYLYFCKTWNNNGNLNGDGVLYRYDFPSKTCSLPILSNSSGFGGGTAFGVSQSGADEIIFLSNGDRYVRLINSTAEIFDSSNPNNLQYHVDMEGFTFNPNNEDEVWMACHGGVYKSIDKGNTWESSMTGLGVAMAWSMATSYENPEDILIGAYHDGCILTTDASYSNNWHPEWKYGWGADGTIVLIDNVNPENMYTSHNSSNWGRSDDGGNTFNAPIGFYSSSWSNEATLNKVQTNIIYGIKNGEVICSYNKGNAWYSGGPAYKTISNIKGITASLTGGVGNVFSSVNDKDVLFASFVNNNLTPHWELYYTLNASNTLIDPTYDWHLLDLNNGGGGIYDVKTDPENSNTIYVTLYPDWSGGSRKMLFKVENFASSTPVIHDLTSNLPNVPGLQIELEKGSDGGIYYSCDAGIYYTNNKLLAADINNAWMLFGFNYPHVPTTGLEINYKINKIRSSTNGRGVWETDLYCPPNGDLTITQNSSPTEFDETNDNIFSSAGNFISTDHVNYRAGKVISLTPGFSSNGAYVHGFIHPCNMAGNSFKIGSINQFEKGEDNDEMEKLKMSNDGNLTIAPNPNNGTFKIIITKNEKAIGIKELKVYDIMGKIVWQTGASENNVFDVNISNYSQGIYYVRSINEEGGVEVQKLVKQ